MSSQQTANKPRIVLRISRKDWSVSIPNESPKKPAEPEEDFSDLLKQAKKQREVLAEGKVLEGTTLFKPATLTPPPTPNSPPSLPSMPDLFTPTSTTTSPEPMPAASNTNKEGLDRIRERLQQKRERLQKSLKEEQEKKISKKRKAAAPIAPMAKIMRKMRGGRR